MYEYFLYTINDYPRRVEMGEHGMPKQVQRWDYYKKEWVATDPQVYYIDLLRDGNKVTEKQVMDQINSHAQIAPEQAVPTTESSANTNQETSKFSNQVKVPFSGRSFQFIGWTK